MLLLKSVCLFAVFAASDTNIVSHVECVNNFNQKIYMNFADHQDQTGKNPFLIAKNPPPSTNLFPSLGRNLKPLISI